MRDRKEIGPCLVWCPSICRRFLRASGDSFRVAWTERRYENGALAATERWTAILTIVVEPPRDAERLRKNPLGVFIHAINWSKELG
jgi:type IV secretory pathway TrbF-like protein